MDNKGVDMGGNHFSGRLDSTFLGSLNWDAYWRLVDRPNQFDSVKAEKKSAKPAKTRKKKTGQG